MNLLGTLQAVIKASGLAYNPNQLYASFKNANLDGEETVDALSKHINLISTTIPELDVLAGGVLLHTSISFSECVARYYCNNTNLSVTFIDLARKYAAVLEKFIRLDRNYKYGYAAAKHFQTLYMLEGENPQYLFMRVSIATHVTNRDIDSIAEMYEALSSGKISMATPILSKSGFVRNQTASCFVGEVDGLFSNIGNFMSITNNHGGIGMSLSRVPRELTRSTLEIINGMSKHQVGSRKNAITIFCDISHPSIETIIDGRRPNVQGNLQINSLFYAVWVSDLFMRRVEANLDWTLFTDVAVTSKLLDVYGETYNKMYCECEQNPHIQKRTVKALALWDRIVRAQAESGTPFVMFKDSINAKNAQSNLGVITGSNLCTEIMQVFSLESMAICNLGSLVLPSFVVDLAEGGSVIDYKGIEYHSGLLTRYLNYILDASYVIVKSNNFSTRPIGIGVVGLASMFQKLMIPYTSPNAQEINRDVFESIYYGALTESCLSSQSQGTSYFRHSPASNGILQFDMWDAASTTKLNWEPLKKNIQRYGLRNSVLCAVMPTATTSLIQECSESVDPITKNVYTRNTSSGSFMVVNKVLVEKLKVSNLWDENFLTRLISHGGSIQAMDLPQVYKDVFKGVWEMSGLELQTVLAMSADRGPFIDQSQSTSLYVDSIEDITPMIFYAWRRGLKGIYYIRLKPLVRLANQETSIGCTNCTV